MADAGYTAFHLLPRVLHSMISVLPNGGGKMGYKYTKWYTVALDDISATEWRKPFSEV